MLSVQRCLCDFCAKACFLLYAAAGIGGVLLRHPESLCACVILCAFAGLSLSHGMELSAAWREWD